MGTATAPSLGKVFGAIRPLLGSAPGGLASGDVVTRVGQGFDFLRVAIIVMAVWLAVPAAAALLIGVWLSRGSSRAAAA